MMAGVALLFITAACVVTFTVLAFRARGWLRVAFVSIAIAFAWLLYGDLMALLAESYVAVKWPLRPLVFRGVCLAGSLVALAVRE